MKFKLAALALALALAGCDNSDDNDTPPPAAPKNVIFFLGDGMGIVPLTAARIYSVGEEGQLTIDTLPESAFVRTYSRDAQVTDSAPSMAAYMTGVKMNNEVISMAAETAAVAPTAAVVDGVSVSNGTNNCPGSGVSAVTLLELAKAAGRSVGAVTTTELTHATPATTYSHICHRNAAYDIAAQVIPGGAGYNAALKDGVDVLLGGGRNHFTPFNKDTNSRGRPDKRDLTAEAKAKGYSYAATKTEMDAVTSGKLLGLFSSTSHLAYELDRKKATSGEAATQPSLAQMTAKAIDLLSKNEKGYFLMVEGGRIDHALHSTNAKRALEDTVAFDNAIKAALAKVDLTNTLIVVTADHDHSMLFNGYAKRTGKTTDTEAGVLGLVKNYAGATAGAPSTDADGKPYSIIGFGNGESRVLDRAAETDLTDAVTSADDYHQQAVIRTGVGSETHGGSDVYLGASGMGADQFHGVITNTEVFGIVKKAAGL